MQSADYFEQYEEGENYQLKTVAEFNQLPSHLWPLYVVDERDQFKVFAQGHFDELFAELLPVQVVDTNVRIICSKPTYLRLSVANRLAQAADELSRRSNRKYLLYITDGYRSLAKQRQQFEGIKQQVAQTGLSGEALYLKTTQLISDPIVCPSHSTGGAVDVTLAERATGQPLALGTAVDAIDTDHIHTWHSALQEPDRSLRVLLYDVMSQAGFVNYALEWWHYSFGEKEWAMRTKQASTLYDSVEELTDDRIIIS